MTRMTGPDCAVMRNFINIYHTHCTVMYCTVLYCTVPVKETILQSRNKLTNPHQYNHKVVNLRGKLLTTIINRSKLPEDKNGKSNTVPSNKRG